MPEQGNLINTDDNIPSSYIGAVRAPYIPCHGPATQLLLICKRLLPSCSFGWEKEKKNSRSWSAACRLTGLY